MRLAANGWRRDCGPTVLASGAFECTDGPKSLRLGEAKAHAWLNWRGGAGVSIAIGAASLRLNGNYLVTLTLSEAELHTLLLLARAGRPLGEAEGACGTACKPLNAPAV